MFNIRQMVESDIPTFNRIRNQSREFLHDPTEYTVEQSLKWFRETSPEFYMLLHNDVEIGYFRTSSRTSDSIWIGLDIDPAHRGKGYSIPAYEAFMDMLSTQGIKIVYLKVLSMNARAIHIYSKLGFVITKRVPNIDRKCDDYFMEYHIDDNDFRFIYTKLTSVDKSAFRNSTILITGCNGFIGTWLVRLFKYLNKTYTFNTKVYAVDIHDELSGVIPDNNIGYYKLNITSGDDVEVLAQKKIDYIFNCAGIAVPSEYMRKPVATLDVSYIGTQNILELAVDIGVKSVVCFSSSEVYGSPEPESIPTKETHIGRIHTHSNRSCYDVGKLVLETLCYTYHQKYGVPVKVIRPFNLFGPYMDDTRVVPNFIRRILDDEPVQIYGTGEQTRTFCYIADAVVMILKAAVIGDDGEIYNVGNSVPEVDMFHLIRGFEYAFGVPIEYEVIPYPSDYPDDEPQRRCPDITKITQLTGYTPLVDLPTGLYRTYEYFKRLQ